MKKVIIIASAILVFILFLLLSLSKTKKGPAINQTPQLTPTTAVIETSTRNQQEQRIINNSIPSTPFENEDFRFDYSPTLKELVVTEKTTQAKEKFFEWAKQNNLSDLASNPELVVFKNKSSSNNQKLGTTPEPSYSPFSEFLNVFMDLGQGEGLNNTQNTNIPSPKAANKQPKNQSPTTNNNKSLVYYAQCDSPYADLPLPDGCNMCQAGCGAATVAMIASSYSGSNFDPKTVINIYKEKGYLLSCDGSRYSDAKSILQSVGLKTTDYIVFDYAPVDQIRDELRKYIAAGWTFFTLGDFKDGEGGGHYFWITDIDEEGNVLAYDPYYGRFDAPPINENSRYPFPKYRLVFGVKK